MEKGKGPDRPILALGLVLGALLACWLIYTDTPCPDLTALAKKTPEKYTMGELEYLLLECVNKGERVPYRIESFRFRRLEQEFTQNTTTWSEPPISRIHASPLHEEFSAYLYYLAAARASTVSGAAPATYWRVLRPYTPAELREMSRGEFFALFDSGAANTQRQSIVPGSQAAPLSSLIPFACI